MKIKTKLTLSVGLLFLMIILLSAVGALYINALKKDTENILVANYNSLEYSKNMLLALEENTTKALSEFKVNLGKQEKNLTEIGEKEATENLRKNFTEYTKNQSNFIPQKSIKAEIFKIMDVNMKAIQRKSDLAKQTAEVATLRIALAGAICFLIAFNLLVNLPSIIPTEPKAILEYAINANKTQAEQKQIQLKTDYPKDLPMVAADSEKTAWVLINLISNAIRYSHENSTINLSIIVDNQYVKFVVKDSGQGIAPQY